MKTPLLTLEDFPADRPNCGNCTRKGGVCPRSKNNKSQHNGYIYGYNGDVVGMIYRCPNYTGICRPKERSSKQLKFDF